MHRHLRLLAIIMAFSAAPAIARTPSDTWTRGATHCPILDVRADPTYTLEMIHVQPARVTPQKRDWSLLDINMHTEFLYFRDLLQGDLDLQLHVDAVIPMKRGGLQLPDHLVAMSLFSEWTWRYVNDTAFRLRLEPGLYSAIPDFGGDAFSMPVGLMLIRTINSTLAATAGISFRPGFERIAMPMAGVVWQPGTHFRMEALVPSGRMTVYLPQDWSCQAFWDWSSETYMLPDDKLNRKRVTFEETRLGLGAAKALSPELRVKVDIGLAGGRTAEFHQEGKSEIARAMFLQIGIGGAF